MGDDKGLYARAHTEIINLLPSLKGETLTREQWWRLLNINLNSSDHIPFKKAVNDVLWNLSTRNKDKLIVKNGNSFKVVDNSINPINYKSVNENAIYDLWLPFGINDYCFLYRKNIMIVFGSKDAGKSAILINIARQNMNNYRVVYWSSEMVDMEFRNRLVNFDGIDIDDWNIEANERSYDFHEVIEPDAVNLIDFLELGGDETEYYKCVGLIRKIWDSLDNGIAIIALQKNKNAEYPKGGTGALEKARIALSLDENKATLVVAKNWKKGVTRSPKGKSWTFNLIGGVNLVNIQPDYGF